jgi:hypothetical protein
MKRLSKQARILFWIIIGLIIFCFCIPFIGCHDVDIKKDVIINKDLDGMKKGYAKYSYHPYDTTPVETIDFVDSDTVYKIGDSLFVKHEKIKQ